MQYSRYERDVHYGQQDLQGSSPERETNCTIRPYTPDDEKAVVSLMKRNFQQSFSLFPEDVVKGYIDANRGVDLRAAVRVDGTEAYVAIVPETKDIGGFFLIRYNPLPGRRNAYGELDLRRIHVHPDMQGRGIGQQLFKHVERRARSREINVEYITTHASGSSRPYFEQNGWNGRTILDHMPKRQTAALVYVAGKRITQEEITLLPHPTHIVYAGANPAKHRSLQAIVAETGSHVDVVSITADEIEDTDVVEAAASKAHSVATKIDRVSRQRTMIVASDIRTDKFMLGREDDPRYKLVNHGKPRSLEEVRGNFTEMLETARAIKKPVPYIVRSATYIIDPYANEDTFSEYDVSVWLSEEGLAELATEEGVKKYYQEVYDTYGVHIFEMSAGFALPIFLKRGYVVGINGHTMHDLPRKDEIIKKAMHTVLSGMDERIMQQRLGKITL